MRKPTDNAAQLRAMSIEEIMARSGLGRTTIYKMLKTGALKARKIGRRTVVLDQDYRECLEALPTYQKSA